MIQVGRLILAVIQLLHFFFQKMRFHFLILFTIHTVFLCWIGLAWWNFSQPRGYWWPASAGHQGPWYWLCGTTMFLYSNGDSSYRSHLSVLTNDKKINIFFCVWRIYIRDCTFNSRPSLIARFMGTTWGPSGADRTQVGPMLAPWTLLSGMVDWILSIRRFYSPLFALNSQLWPPHPPTKIHLHFLSFLNIACSD